MWWPYDRSLAWENGLSNLPMRYSRFQLHIELLAFQPLVSFHGKASGLLLRLVWVFFCFLFWCFEMWKSCSSKISHSNQPAIKAGIGNCTVLLKIIVICYYREDSILPHEKTREPAVWRAPTAYFEACASVYNASFEWVLGHEERSWEPQEGKGSLKQPCPVPADHHLDMKLFLIFQQEMNCTLEACALGAGKLVVVSNWQFWKYEVEFPEEARRLAKGSTCRWVDEKRKVGRDVQNDCWLLQCSSYLVSGAEQERELPGSFLWCNFYANFHISLKQPLNILILSAFGYVCKWASHRFEQNDS